MVKEKTEEKPESVQIPEQYKELFGQREQLYSDINTDLRRLAGTINALHEVENQLLGKLFKDAQ